MPLLEVIPHAGTDPDAVATALAFGRKMGKTVIVVADHTKMGVVSNFLSLPLERADVLVTDRKTEELVDAEMLHSLGLKLVFVDL